jgi:WD40 repeat protein
MTDQHPKPIIFLAFANDRQQSGQYLRNLGQEAARLRSILEKAKASGLCELVERQSVTPEHLLEVFNNKEYANRIAVFHYGGHADDYALLLETAEGNHFMADGRGLAAVLRHQTGLQLVFLNACSTRAQANELLNAGVQVVVATSRAVDDELATNFAANFYELLAAGASIDTAFARAVDGRKFATDELTRHLRPAHLQQDHTADGWPWAMYVQSGAELARQWNLPQAAGDPLFGLPSLPKLDPPARPYRHLEWYTREQAELFFGRGPQIRDLYQRVTEQDGAPIILLYGQSGVGKSSVLDAGLRPRLECDHITLYRRRDQDRGLLGTLQDALGSATAAAWCAKEGQEDKPLVLIVDQLEEVFTRPNAQRPNELDEFLAALQDIFSDRTRRPQGKLILGFRKEWLAEIEKQLKDRRAFFNKVFLNRLDRAGILEVVHGPTRVPRLQHHYRLTIDAALPREIADDLLADPRSPVAPVLQILLAKLWHAACDRQQSAPHFDQALYHQLKREGIGLDDFLTQQLQVLRHWRPSVVDSGLALDLLSFHTTPLGTAEQRDEEKVQAFYSHIQDLPNLVQKYKDLYLLADSVEDQATAAKPTRLAHDTLAPLVRKRFDESDAPGQRARRILESRAVDWKSNINGTPLDTTDLAVVESGAAGMRAWTAEETRLVEASRAAQRRRARVRRGAIGLLIVGVLVIIGTAIIALRQREVAFSREFAASSLSQLSVDPERSLLLAIEAAKRAPTSQAEDALRQSLQLSHVRAFMEGHEAQLESIAFSPDGKRVVTASFDNTGRVWDAATGAAIVPLNGHSGWVTSAAFSYTDGGQRIVTASYDKTARVWNASTGEPLAVLSGHGAKLNGAAFSPDDKLILTWSEDMTARLWDAATWREVAILDKHEGKVHSAAFSRDGTRVVTGGNDGTARVWETATGRPVAILDAHTQLVHYAAFSPDGMLVVTAGGDKRHGDGTDTGTARVWEVATQKKVAEMRGHIDIVQHAEFSPSGERIVTASHDASARVWEARTGKQVAALIGHNRVVTTATFSPDGNFILTASHDNTGRLWEATTGRTLLELRGHTGSIESATFSPDGKLVATVSADKTARVAGEPRRAARAPELRPRRSVQPRRQARRHS